MPSQKKQLMNRMIRLERFGAAFVWMFFMAPMVHPIAGYPVDCA